MARGFEAVYGHYTGGVGYWAVTRRKDIVWQILTESIVLSTFGGMMGTGLGFGTAYVISLASPLPAAVETWSVALGIGMTAAVGLFFGLYPAMKAATLDPIEALRRE